MRGAPRGPGAMNRRQRPAANGQQIHRSAPGQGRGGGPSKQSNHAADRNQPSNFNSPSKTKNANAAAKRTEPQRTFTDFRLVGLKIRGHAWSWGSVPQDEVEAVQHSVAEASGSITGQDEQPKTENVKTEVNNTSSQQPPLTPQAAGACRIRIYFHNPKINGEAIGPGPSSPTVTRTGKRKKMDDDDDLEFESELRARQRPPPGFVLKKESSFADTGSGEASVRGSLFGDGDGDSVTRREMSISASHAGTEEPEEDWLMAAIADGSGAAADTDVAAAGDHAATSATTLPDAGDSTASFAPVAPVHADGSSTVDATAPPAGPVPADDPSTALEQPGVQPRPDTDASAADNSLISSLYDAPPTHEPSVPDVDAAQTTESAPVPASSVPISSGSPSASVTATAVASDHGVDATAESAAPATSEVAHDDSVPIEETEMDVSAEYAQEAGSMFSPSSHLDDHASAIDDASVAGADASTNVGDQSVLVVDDSSIGWSRLSVTYAGGAKRLVFDSAVVQKMTIHRAEGRIDIDLKVEKLGEGPALNGIILEALVSAASQEYEPLSWAISDDTLIPPFATFESPSNITLVAYLDRDKPLSAPKWLKTGDLQEWLKVSLGKAAAIPGEDSWIGRIEVADPDPPPSIHTVLDLWARSSSVGKQADRLAFVDEHMKDVRNILEVLLRLVRSDRAAPFNARTEQQSAPLAAALPHGSGLANHQTHITLAILAVYKLAEDQALSTGTLATLTSHIGEIVRCIPQHLIHKSLDAIYGSKIGVAVPTTNGKKQGK
ncbi:hypothetical protein AURDEDRAFT_110617 [Auricularia subglabra TFB-10046 SS5]|nr:hypothetical protein AURDEDRAFT_110617 [Auricularia subglabra TFB-10046 SS5]